MLRRANIGTIVMGNMTYNAGTQNTQNNNGDSGAAGQQGLRETMAEYDRRNEERYNNLVGRHDNLIQAVTGPRPEVDPQEKHERRAQANDRTDIPGMSDVRGNIFSSPDTTSPDVATAPIVTTVDSSPESTLDAKKQEDAEPPAKEIATPVDGKKSVEPEDAKNQEDIVLFKKSEGSDKYEKVGEGLIAGPTSCTGQGMSFAMLLKDGSSCVVKLLYVHDMKLQPRQDGSWKLTGHGMIENEGRIHEGLIGLFKRRGASGPEELHTLEQDFRRLKTNALQTTKKRLNDPPDLANEPTESTAESTESDELGKEPEKEETAGPTLKPAAAMTKVSASGAMDVTPFVPPPSLASAAKSTDAFEDGKDEASNLGNCQVNKKSNAAEAAVAHVDEKEWHPKVHDLVQVKRKYKVERYRGAVGEIVDESPKGLFHIRFKDEGLAVIKVKKVSFHKAL